MNEANKHLIQLEQLLRLQGITKTSAILQTLNISKATLSRIAAQLPSSIIRFGKGSKTQFGLLNALHSIDSKLPIFHVQENGQLLPIAQLAVFHGQKYLMTTHDVVTKKTNETLYLGFPPHLAEMVPQGFMGRAFAENFSTELCIPNRPIDWSNDHALIAIARRGEDLPGNWIIGKESAERFQNKAYAEISRADYPTLSRSAMIGQPAGSSAGGEQPKFSALVEGEHRLVKFAGMDATPAQIRWRDLLVCEHLALNLLSEYGIDAAKSGLHEIENQLFLEIKRFDRVGIRGRKSILTLASIDDHHFGMRDNWCSASERMLRSGLINSTAAQKIQLLDAFALCISDSDRHFYNLSFFCNSNGFNGTETYQLAPAFDKLPMQYAPIAGQLIHKPIKAVTPLAQMIPVWAKAKSMALDFWNRVDQNKLISKEFKSIAKETLTTLNSDNN
jgi:hypothetical protein